jgi:P-type Mg2+ transporter
MKKDPLSVFWSHPASAIFAELGASPAGFDRAEALRRRDRTNPGRLKSRRRAAIARLFFAQFKSPITLILFGAVILSYFLGDAVNAAIILFIVLASGILGFTQEKGAFDTVEKLQARVRVEASVLRDGVFANIPTEDVVPGDIVDFNAGDVIPGDCLILESRDLFVDEATLTGETFPVEKAPGVLPSGTPTPGLTNSLFMGTHVVSGTARALVVRTGRKTEFGKISARLAMDPPETEFERGVRRFGYFLMELTLVLLTAIFAINVYFARPVLDSFLFALALAVGLTPQLLPVIISINLAHGARIMALEKVIVKKLNSIENFGSMNVLCADKTGTLTEGIVRIKSALGLDGQESEAVLKLAYLNALHETGFGNPVDEAIRKHRSFDAAGWEKLDEVPYDFIRKRLSVLLSRDGRNLMITKGALGSVLEACSRAETRDGKIVEAAGTAASVLAAAADLNARGWRTLGVAWRDLGAERQISKESERGMVFAGFLVLEDPVKDGIAQIVADLGTLGVTLKIVTGDNAGVAAEAARKIGLAQPRVVTGPEIRRMSNEALVLRAPETDVFAEVEPNQKERIILSLRRAGNVVGFLGDGINDATALHAADVGISVEGAVDVAKEAADIILLEKDLGVLAKGVRNGRRTFANTMKYVFMATSANFGNMFSMAGASLVLSFLPLLPKQILLTNLLTDLPEMTIAGDRVDRELIERPRRWDFRSIRRFMLIFGSLSSVFDILTFVVLLLVLRAGPAEFRTGWFLESVVSATAAVLVVRTRRPFFRSLPGRGLVAATVLVALVTLVFPLLPLGRIFGFGRIGGVFYLILGGIVVLYVISAEAIKAVFYRRMGKSNEA